jgi:hypothetical protein
MAGGFADVTDGFICAPAARPNWVVGMALFQFALEGLGVAFDYKHPLLLEL